MRREVHVRFCERPVVRFHRPTQPHYVRRTRSGGFAVGRKTQRERIRNKLKALGQQLSRLRLEGGRAMADFARRHLEGHIQYYGVSGNSRSLRCYAYQVARLLFKWLNRRSQRRAINWQRYASVLPQLLPRARLVHNLYSHPLWRPHAGSRMV